KPLRTEPFAQHAVLGEKIVDRHLLPSLQESRNQQDEELKGRAALLVVHRADHRLRGDPGGNARAGARRSGTPHSSTASTLGPYDGGGSRTLIHCRLSPMDPDVTRSELAGKGPEDSTADERRGASAAVEADDLQGPPSAQGRYVLLERIGLGGM